MKPEPIAILREALEAKIGSLATTLLSESIARSGGRSPEDLPGVLLFLHGAVRAGIQQELGTEEGEALIEHLDERLRSAVQTPSSRFRASRPTRDLPRVSGPVGVRVESGTPTLATLLVVSLGANRLEAVSAERLEGALLIVDASDPPGTSVDTLVARAKEASLTLLWANESLYGRELSIAFSQAGVAHAGFDTAGGIEPLMDVLRARSAGAG